MNEYEQLGLVKDPRDEEEKKLDYKHEILYGVSSVTWGRKFIIGLAGFLAAVGVIVKFLLSKWTF